MLTRCHICGKRHFNGSSRQRQCQAQGHLSSSRLANTGISTPSLSAGMQTTSRRSKPSGFMTSEKWSALIKEDMERKPKELESMSEVPEFVTHIPGRYMEKLVKESAIHDFMGLGPGGEWDYGMSWSPDTGNHPLSEAIRQKAKEGLNPVMDVYHRTRSDDRELSDEEKLTLIRAQSNLDAVIEFAETNTSYDAEYRQRGRDPLGERIEPSDARHTSQVTGSIVRMARGIQRDIETLIFEGKSPYER